MIRARAPRFAALVASVAAAALLVPPVASARPKADPSTLSTAIKNDVVDAVAMEMVRALSKLRIPRAPKPYFIGYKLTEVEVNDVNASLGSTTARKQRHFVNLEAHVRAGDYKFDNSNFVVSRSARTDGVSAITLSLEPSPKIARRAAWLVTDAAYKEALAQLLAKIDHRRAGGGGAADVPSYTKQQAVVDEKPKLVPRLESNVALEARANKISAVFRGQMHLRDSRVAFTSFLERRWYLNSEGTNAHDTRRVSGVVIAVTAQADDGQDLALYYSRYGMTAADLPSDAELIAEAKKLSRKMALLRKAPVMSNYTGPVLFEGAGAIGFTRYTLAPHLGGTPIPAGLEKGQAKRFGGALAGRIGFRAISPLLSVTDDPTMSRIGRRRLIGGYRYDDEGTRAQRVELIKNGKLITLLSSRTPSKDVPASNGHARRGAPGGDFHGSATNLLVSAKRGKSRRQLERMLLREAKAQGHKFALVITQLDDAAITSAPELSRREMYRLLNDTDVDAPPPALLAYRVYPSGKRELVRGVQLKPITMRAWRDVVAVGKKRTIANFLASTENHLSHKLQGVGRGFVPSSGVESSISTPDLLLKELEIVGSATGRRALPLIPRPAK